MNGVSQSRIQTSFFPLFVYLPGQVLRFLPLDVNSQGNIWVLVFLSGIKHLLLVELATNLFFHSWNNLYHNRLNKVG